MFVVELDWCGRWVPIAEFNSRDDAEWAIAGWRSNHGSNGQDTGFRVVEITKEAKPVRKMAGRKSGSNEFFRLKILD